MTAVELITNWLSPIIAAVYVVGYSQIFEPVRSSKMTPRFLVRLFDCPMCIGFWAGIVIGIVNWAPVEWPAPLSYATIGGCLAVSVEYLLELLGRT